MDNDKEASNDYFFIPQESLVDIIPPQQLAIDYNASNIFVALSSSLVLHSPT
jgi:hypothetical protein